MIHRLPRLALAAALALTPLAVSAQSDDHIAEPTSQDRTDLQTCLEMAREAGGPRQGCIETVSGPCLDSPESAATPLMTACANRELVLWDELLNDWYGQLVEALNPDQTAALKASQRGWIAVRDQSCEFQAMLWEGGTGAGPDYHLCLMRQTGERAIFLADALDFISGN